MLRTAAIGVEPKLDSPSLIESWCSAQSYRSETAGAHSSGPMLLDTRTPTLLLGLALSTACAIPHGSNARPVTPLEDARTRIAVGGVVPFAAAGQAFDGEDDASFDSVADEALLIPAASYDFVFEGGRQTFGLEVALLTGDLSTARDSSSDLFGVFINPRFETPISDFVSFTIDLNLGYFTDGSDSTPWIVPTFGIRAYLPTGFGGFVLSQQLGTAVVTVATPGSLAYDIPIPLGDGARLHLFPEVKWDPTFAFIGDGSGVVALFSGGLSLMFEL